jgi:5-methylcytosine-specific restriction enzyme A
MPNKAMKFCLHPGCSELTSNAYCAAHQQEHEQAAYKRRDNKWLHLYHDPRWCNPVWGLRAMQLREYPFCVDCIKEGRPLSESLATVADHIKPHKGNPTLFFNKGNLQSQCDQHHNRKTAREDGGFGNPRG